MKYVNKKSVSQLIEDELQLETGSDAFKQVFIETLKHITKAITAFQYQAVLKELVEFNQLPISAKDFRLKLNSNDSFFKLKFYALRLAKTRQFNSISGSAAKTLGKEYGVHKVDAYFAFNLYRHDPKYRKVIRTSPLCEELSMSDVTPEALAKSQEMFARMYPKLRSCANGVAYRKLRFVSSSTNLSLNDLNSELLLKALQAFRQTVPSSREELHILNTLKSSITNHALNMISSATTQKRGRLVNEGADGFGGSNFALMVASESQLYKNKESDEMAAYDERMSSEFISSMAEKEINSITVEQLLRRYRKAHKKHRVIELLLGTDDAEFTDYLRSKRMIGTRADNVDFISTTCQGKLVEAIGGFLNVCVNKLEAFLSTLRKDILGYA